MHNVGTVSLAILMKAVQQYTHTWFTMVCKSFVSKSAVVIQLEPSQMTSTEF